jgi:hypothetical protein
MTHHRKHKTRLQRLLAAVLLTNAKRKRRGRR